LDAEVSPNYFAVVKSSHPLSLSAEGGPVHFLGSPGKYYLYVPAGTKEFAVKVFGEGGEGIKATLLNPKGEVFGEQDDISATHQFEVEQPEGTAGGVWVLKLGKATNVHLEDHYVDLLGIPGFLSLSPEAVLVQAQ
ncbi:MAG: hypothetical protein WCP21_06575, partial [Armatimonadota bacterium]